MATDPYLWALVVLPVWAALVGLPLGIRGTPVPSVAQLGYLRRGPDGAVRTAVTDLHADGLVEVRGPGMIARSRTPMRSGGDPLARAVYAAMPTPAQVRALRGRSRVRVALAEVTRQLAAAGLVPGRARWLAARVALLVVLGVSVAGLLAPEPSSSVVPWYTIGLAAGCWLVPRRTVAGHRLLARRRRAFAAGTGESPSESPDPVAGYALHGRVPPELSRAFARPRRRSQSDSSSSRPDSWQHYAGGGPP